MKDKLNELTEKLAEQMNDMTVDFLEKSVSQYFHGFEEALKTMGMGSFFVNRLFDGGVVPAINSALEIEKDFTDSLLQVMSGEKDWSTYIQEMYNRMYAGTRYEELVQTLGKEIFGAAVFKGEKRLAETDHFTLTYIPAKEGTTKQKAARTIALVGQRQQLASQLAELVGLGRALLGAVAAIACADQSLAGGLHQLAGLPQGRFGQHHRVAARIDQALLAGDALVGDVGPLSPRGTGGVVAGLVDALAVGHGGLRLGHVALAALQAVHGGFVSVGG